MKNFLYRGAALLLVAALGVICGAGCRPKQTDETGNSAMSEKQKAILAEHKKKQDQ